MSIFANRMAVFDLDGTLADTSRDLIEAANTCFRLLGYHPPLDPCNDKLTAFRGGRAMLKLGFERLNNNQFSGQEVEIQYPKLLQAYDQAINRYTHLYDGVGTALEILRKSGWKLAVCTNKPEQLAIKLLSKLGQLHQFVTVVGADTFPYRKPDPKVYRKTVEISGGQVSRSFMVGDTVTDSKTAQAAGVPFVYAALNTDGICKNGHQTTVCFYHYNELPEIADRIIGN